VYAEPGWKNTGTQPASMASNADRRVYESPGGCRQNAALLKWRVYEFFFPEPLTNACSVTPAAGEFLLLAFFCVCGRCC
jgi:hypothetical protein